MTVPEPSSRPRRGSAPWAPWRRWTLAGLGVVAAVGGPVVIRVAVEGRWALEAARAVSDPALRIELLGRAARWRMPGAPYDDDALDELLALGEAAASQGQPRRSLAAYREARGALLGTRAWGLSDPELFEALNRKIARLMAAQERAQGTDVGGEGDPYAYHLRLLQVRPGPEPLIANAAAFAFAAWLATLVGLVLRGFEPSGQLHRGRATRWGVAAAALLIAWCALLAAG